MKTIITLIKGHAEAAKSAPDRINHLDAIIGACGLLEQEIERNDAPLDTVKKLIKTNRDFYQAKAKEIELERIPVEKLIAAYYERDRLLFTAGVLNELLNRSE